MTQLYARHDSFLCVTCLIHISLSLIHTFTCATCHSYVQHDSIICATRLTYARHDSFLCVTCLIHRSLSHTHTFICATRLIQVSLEQQRSTSTNEKVELLQRAAVRCSVLQCVAVCGSVLQCTNEIPPLCSNSNRNSTRGGISVLLCCEEVEFLYSESHHLIVTVQQCSTKRWNFCCCKFLLLLL